MPATARPAGVPPPPRCGAPDLVDQRIDLRVVRQRFLRQDLLISLQAHLAFLALADQHHLRAAGDRCRFARGEQDGRAAESGEDRKPKRMHRTLRSPIGQVETQSGRAPIRPREAGAAAAQAIRGRGRALLPRRRAAPRRSANISSDPSGRRSDRADATHPRWSERHTGDRRAARPVEHGQHGMLGRDAGRGRRVIDARQPFPGRQIVDAAFEAHGPLASGRQHLVLGDRSSDMAEAKALVLPAPGEWPRPLRLRAWPAVCRHPRSVTICGSGLRCRSWARRRNAEVPTIAPRFRSAMRATSPAISTSRASSRGRKRRDGQAGQLNRRHVLHAVNGGIDAAGEQRFPRSP